MSRRSNKAKNGAAEAETKAASKAAQTMEPSQAAPAADAVLEAVFAVVVAKAREDRKFAERLITALGKDVALARPKRTPVVVDPPDALLALDLSALIAEDGRRKTQRALEDAPFTVAEYRAFAEARGVSLRGVPRRRLDIISAILTAYAPLRAGAFN